MSGSHRLAGGYRSMEGLEHTFATPRTAMRRRRVQWAPSERIDTVDARDIEPILTGLAPSLVVGIDAADAAEIVLGLLGVPLVERQLVLSFDDSQALDRHACHDCALSPAQ